MGGICAGKISVFRFHNGFFRSHVLLWNDDDKKKQEAEQLAGLAIHDLHLYVFQSSSYLRDTLITNQYLSFPEEYKVPIKHGLA